MLKEWLKNLLLSNSFINEQVKNAYNIGVIAERKRSEESRADSDLITQQEFVGKPVISFSNEWENPIIGFCTEITFITKAQNPVLMVKDYLTGETLMVLGKTFIYTEERFNAVMKLSPWELLGIAFSYPWAEASNATRKKIGVTDTPVVVREKLEESGFYKDLRNYYDEQFGVAG